MAHIQDRRQQGRGWVARYLGLDGRERSKAFPRKAAAERWLKEQEAAMLRGEWADPRLAKTTVASYFQTWAKRQPWRDSWRIAVGSMWRNHIEPAFGGRALATIRRGDIESWASGLPLGGRSAQLCQQTLSTLLEAAVADGYIAVNPSRHAKKPRVDEVPVVPYTADELDSLRDAAPDWFRVALTLGAASGLRQGEATGLTADRIDFLRRTLTVDRQYNPRGEGFTPPKNKRGYRTIPLADVAVESIASHIEQHGTGSDGLVLHHEGGPVDRNRFGRTWRRLRIRAGLPSARFHDTRHTYAAVLLSAGVSVAAAADYMGHTPAVLLRTYAHLIPADHDRARGAVQDAFSRLSNGTETGQGEVAAQ